MGFHDISPPPPKKRYTCPAVTRPKTPSVFNVFKRIEFRAGEVKSGGEK